MRSYTDHRLKSSIRRDTDTHITLNLADGESVPQLFEGLCRFRNELIHEDGMDLLRIYGLGAPQVVAGGLVS